MLGFDPVGLAHYRLTVGYVDGYFNYFKVGVYMKKLTVEKAKELIDQFCQNGCSCKEEYYLQALEAFVDQQDISSSQRTLFGCEIAPETVLDTTNTESTVKEKL